MTRLVHWACNLQELLDRINSSEDLTGPMVNAEAPRPVAACHERPTTVGEVCWDQ